MLSLRLTHQASILVDRTRHWHRVNKKALGDSDAMTRSVPSSGVQRQEWICGSSYDCPIMRDKLVEIADKI